MTIEAFITRELEIRFIDARAIGTEAKLNLGIHGYPDKVQLQALKAESCRIFRSWTEEERHAMQRLNANLREAKIPCGSGSSSRRGSMQSNADSSQRSGRSIDTSIRRNRRIPMLIGR